jgi:phosphoribosyl 1,2-cyclic phosphodiesterase/DNA-binding response OmpR family regulator
MSREPAMRVRFWGTRGSIAKPGASTIRYGGNTSCVEVRSAAGTLVVLDCGTGAHDLGRSLMAGARQPLRGHMLITHTHWDHIQGLPFFAPLFVPGNEWDIYAPRGLAQSLRETLAGQMQYTYFPLTLEQLGATVRYHDLVEGAFRIGEIEVRAQYLNHPALTLGYRLEAGGACLVYATDHEPYSSPLASGCGEISGRDLHHAEFLAGADLLIHDAQYTAQEYPDKAGWGHSGYDYVLALARRAGVKRLALTHHDPSRDDDALDRIVETLRTGEADRTEPLEVFAAAEGQTVALEAVVGARPGRERDDFSAVTPVAPACGEITVLLAVADPATARPIAEELRNDGLEVVVAADCEAALQIVAAAHPSLVIVQRDLPGAGGLGVCRTIRGAPGAYAREVPVIILAEEEEHAAGADAGVTDWLIQPFSGIYARTRVRAWLLRAECRWKRPPLPEDEERRLAALRRLGILDTPREERFDRLTRLAAALFDVPIALVSLVDRDRQWYKSCHGVNEIGTAREVSFCAHAILHREVMIVPDALHDSRFADNPLVTGEPNIRFYAGCPIEMHGSQIGTLCIVDTRPHQLDEAKTRLLRDLAALVRQELARVPPASVDADVAL